MIFGTWEFAITYDIYERSDDGKWIFGFFNIVIDDELLIHRGSNWTLNCIVSYLKKNISSIEQKVLDEPDLDKDTLFIKSSKSNGYGVYTDPQIPDSWWESNDLEIKAKLDLHLKSLEDEKKQPQFGIAIELFGELDDTGWQFYLFGAGRQERLIYSKDAGKTVFEKRLPRGTVEKVLRSLPNPEDL